jgi:maltooligosyltrehalose trehalohydrolase
VPDPQDPATFERSKLDWAEVDGPRGARLLEVYRTLARLRRTVPDLTDPAFAATSCTVDEDARLFRMRRRSVEVVVNFADSPTQVSVGDGASLLFGTGDDVALAAGVLSLPAHAGALVRLAAGAA